MRVVLEGLRREVRGQKQQGGEDDDDGVNPDDDDGKQQEDKNNEEEEERERRAEAKLKARIMNRSGFLLGMGLGGAAWAFEKWK